MQKAQSPSSMPWGSGERHLVPREPEEITENVSDLRLGKQRHVFLAKKKKKAFLAELVISGKSILHGFFF